MVANTGEILLLLTCLALATVVEARWLNQFVRHFEPLSYTPLPVHRDHMRVKRSLAHREKQRPGHVYLRFGGFNRIFRLRLRPDTSVFHPDLVVQTSRFGRVKPDIGHIYSGKLVGEPSSHVFGALHDGVFEGTIQSRMERFYVEGAHKFFSRLTPFHSVLYSARDVRMPGVDGSPGWCGVRGQTARWMSQLAAGSKLVHPAKRKSRHQDTQREPRIGRRRPLAGELPTEGASHTDGGLDGGQGDRGSAKKRARQQQTSRPKRVCGLFIAIDHLLYEKFTEPDRDPVRTRERLSTLIAGHVARASEVYRRTRFGDIEDISFSVHRIEINDTTSCPNRRAGFCLNKMDAALYLLTLSKWRVFDEFCLAYAWTYRDFDDGVIGLAYTANTSAQAAGLCDRNRYMPEDPGNPTRGFMKVNLNTGIITFINSNHHLAQAVSEIAFCHEIGHNFGSPHDEPIGGACAPGSASGGNYIMYPKAIYGQMPNNYRFSACSIRNMTNVIVPMLEGTNNRENCLEAYHGPICGNHLVEGGEECDCGYTESECSDKCCYARRNSVNAPGCRLKAGKLCSPSSGPCCTGGCVLSHSTVVCRQETECQEESRCTGLSTDCPPAKNKADYSPCSGGTEVCLKGSCKGSVCLNYSLEGCTLSGSKYSIDAKCLVACHSGGKCRPACEIPGMRAQCGLKMRPGAICDDLRGYCDVFHKCRGIDEKGPLTRLHETLFRFQSLKEYITAHPFMATVYVLTFIALNVLFFHCFALHTPSNNPRRPTRNIVESLRKPANLFKL